MFRFAEGGWGQGRRISMVAGAGRSGVRGQKNPRLAAFAAGRGFEIFRDRAATCGGGS